MQFLGSTWRRGTPRMSVPPAGPPTRTTIDGYAADGDGDGVADVWNPADAIAGAARLLRANGAPADYSRAVFAYNRADWYVRQVFELAASYRAAAATISVQLGNLAAAVASALGNPRIQLTSLQRMDLASGRIDPRVVALLAWIGERHALVVTSLRSDHSYLTTAGFVSNHSYGRAVDISAIDGTPVLGDQRPGGKTESALRTILLLPRELRPAQLISLFDMGDPSFALADHHDHIHVGY